jgi:hypothetical protein
MVTFIMTGYLRSDCGQADYYLLSRSQDQDMLFFLQL